MIFDCFMFNDELDVLEIRLNELFDKVDYFVLVESAYTHKNKPKPLYYINNEKRFKKFKNKILYNKIDNFKNIPELDEYTFYNKKKYLNFKILSDSSIDNWKREFYQRSCIFDSLRSIAKPDDIILISDVDEIPNPEKISLIEKFIDKKKIIVFEQNWHFLYLNNISSAIWKGTKAIKYRDMVNRGGKLYIQEVRYMSKNIENISNGGWHLEALGGIHKARKKIDAWLEKEMFADGQGKKYTEKYIKFDLNIIDSGLSFDTFEDNYTLPKYCETKEFNKKRFIKTIDYDKNNEDIVFLRSEVIRLRKAWNELNMKYQLLRGNRE